MGIGIQGAVYRYQVTEYGVFFFPITREIVFVLNGTYSPKTALSVVLWGVGTVLLTITTFFSFIHVQDRIVNYYRQIITGLFFSCVIFLCSCVAQYGFFFNGPAGVSYPAGILLIITWSGMGWYFRHTIINFLDSK